MVQADLYLDKVRACWLGKNIGGTLGMPYEGVPGPLSLRFYDPVPTQAVANDDLDLQLLWLVLIEEHGWGLNHKVLGDAWLKYQTCPSDEYGVARWNLRRGIAPPLSGVHNNWFRGGMGAVIRSEIWACLFPMRPHWAARFAWLDATVDHAGDGVWAEVFLAACQSAAFGISDVGEAMAAGLEHLPAESRFARMVRKLLAMHHAGDKPESALAWINNHVHSHNFTDCVMNMAFVIYALLWGEGEFERSLLMAVNCGQDADCTGATCAATFGLLHGTRAIPERWREPVGETVVASEYLQCLPMPTTLEELATRTAAQSARLLSQIETVGIPQIPTECADIIDDGITWRICPKSAAEMGEGLSAPDSIQDDARASTVSSPGICIDLAPYCQADESILFLETAVTCKRTTEAYLLLCSQAGLTAWWDGRMILNYHGRRPIVPALHRTEGGGCIPIDLEVGRTHRLQVRLIGCRAPLDFLAAIGDSEGDYRLDIKFTAESS